MVGRWNLKRVARLAWASSIFELDRQILLVLPTLLRPPKLSSSEGQCEGKVGPHSGYVTSYSAKHGVGSSQSRGNRATELCSPNCQQAQSGRGINIVFQLVGLSQGVGLRRKGEGAYGREGVWLWVVWSA
jgi:hypothetical protein